MINKAVSDTYLQTKLIILKEQMESDPEFKEQLRAYIELVTEFGVKDPPVYLKEKLDEIDVLVEARMKSLGQSN